MFLGVIGIVAFGSVNSGLQSDLDYERLDQLWSRGGWLSYFIVMTVALIVVYIGTSQLDSVLASRSDLASLPTSRSGVAGSRRDQSLWAQTQERLASSANWLRDQLDAWMSARDDRYVSWVLGIGWSCIGGALAGACLIVSILPNNVDVWVLTHLTSLSSRKRRTCWPS